MQAGKKYIILATNYLCAWCTVKVLLNESATLWYAICSDNIILWGMLC